MSGDDGAGDTPRYGYTDEELLTLPTVYRDGLFAGKVALVSGAGTGLGKATALLLARLGAVVAICGRKAEKLEATAALVSAVGSESLAQATNIRDPEQVDALFDAALDRFGRVDYVVNNAGGQFPQPSLEIPLKGWNAVIDTNLNGTWHMMQRAARAMAEQPEGGAIVNIVVPQRGMFQVAHTVAARAAVESLTRNLAVEWAPHKIRVNAVQPGPISTEGMNVYPPEAQAAMRASNPLFAFGDVQDVAEACVYLLAPSAKFITGEIVIVDGGLRLWGELWLAGKPGYFRKGPP